MVGPFGLSPRGTMRVRALSMARALAARGHQVSMVLPPWQNPEDAGRCWEEDGVSVENVPLPPRIPGVFEGLIALRLLRRTLALRPDVVHLFKPKAYSGLTHWLLARVSPSGGPRLVVDTDDWEGPGGWNEIGDYSPLQRRFFTWQERWGLTHADAVTAASRTLESLVWSMGVPRQHVFYVPNGVAESRRVRGEEREDGKRVLLYTRFFEFPVSRVIDVLVRVREQVPEARMLVVGEGLHGEEKELFALAAEAGLEVVRFSGASGSAEQPRLLAWGGYEEAADVAFAGWVSPEMLASTFALVDVAIYPFDDTLVNRTKCAAKLVDLLAAGLPVVAEAVGQNREYIRHEETGLLVESGDVSSFAASVVELLEHPSLRRRMGEAAARDVEERFSWRRLVKIVERAYGVQG